MARDYRAINGNSQGDTSGVYTAQGGENLAQVAATLWGDGALWYKLAEANGLTGGETLTAGRTLTIPPDVGTIHNSADTFKPYDAASAVGNTSPNTPKPPKEKCGVVGQLLIAVISVAVAIWASPGAIAIFKGLGTVGAAIAGGALAGAAGSAASQAVGVASGIQDKFSFKDVGMAALGGAVGGGFKGLGDLAKAGKLTGSLSKIGSFLSDASTKAGVVRGVLSSAVTQGIGVATGLQDKFSWAGVAAAGVGAGVGTALSGVGGLFGVKISGDSFGSQLGRSAASAIANAATRSAIEGSSFDNNLRAAIPDVIGQAVGGAIGGAVLGGGRDELDVGRMLEAAERNRVDRERRRDSEPGVQLAMIAGDSSFAYEWSARILDYASKILNNPSIDVKAFSEEIVVTAKKYEPYWTGNRPPSSLIPSEMAAFSARVSQSMTEQNARRQAVVQRNERSLGRQVARSSWRFEWPSNIVNNAFNNMPSLFAGEEVRARGGSDLSASIAAANGTQNYVNQGIANMATGLQETTLGISATTLFPPNWLWTRNSDSQYVKGGGDAGLLNWLGPVARGVRLAVPTRLAAAESEILTGGMRYTGRRLDVRAKFIDSPSAQSTSPGHSFASRRAAYELALDPAVERVTMNAGYNRLLRLEPGTISPNVRPDAAAIFFDGRVARTEIMSSSDIESVLRTRNTNLNTQLRAQGYNPQPPVILSPRLGN